MNPLTIPDEEPVKEEIFDENEAFIDPMPTNTTSLLAKIQHTGDELITKKVGYMAHVASSIASLSEPSNDDKKEDTQVFDNTEQVLYRLTILREIQKDLDLLKSENVKTDMSEPQFLYETMPIVRDMVSVVEFFNEEVAEEAMKTVTGLINLKESLFDLSVQKVDSFRNTYLQTLENLNAYARLRDSETVRDFVLEKTYDVENLICSFDQLNQSFKYEGYGEVSFVLRSFDQAVAYKKDAETMIVNDVTYQLKPFDLYDSFAVFPGELCAQVTSVKGLADDAKDLYSESIMQVSVF